MASRTGTPESPSSSDSVRVVIGTGRATLSELDVAHELATIAARVALPYFSGSNRSWLKADKSAVSDADLAVEASLLERLTELRGEDAILSEE